MYFEDLSPYTYDDLPKPLAGVFNVGWLAEGKPFNRGVAPPGFISNLKRWRLGALARQMRGYVLCRFCPRENYRSAKDYAQMQVLFEGHRIYIGSAEIWIPGSDGSIYAAPDFILHYVEMHEYLPPPQFVEAVMQPIPVDWKADAVAEMMVANAYK